MAKEISPNSLSLIKNEICNLKQEVPFPWRELGKASNRYFESDVDAYEWLDEVLLALMELGVIKYARSSESQYCNALAQVAR